MDALQEMGRGDVGEIEGRILAHEHRIHRRQIDPLGRAQGEVIALHVARLDGLRHGDHLAVAQGQAVGRVVQHPMPPPLGFEQQRKARIAGDLDAADMIHLDRDGEGHGSGLLELLPLPWNHLFTLGCRIF